MFKSGFSIVTDSKCARHPPEIFVQLPLDIPERKVHELLMDCNYLCLSNVWNENHCIDPTILETCIHQIQCESNQTNSVERAREREAVLFFSVQICHKLCWNIVAIIKSHETMRAHN